MSGELILRIIGYLSLLGAILYLIFLFAPPVRGGDLAVWRERLVSVLRSVRLPQLPWAPRELTAPERGAAIALIEGYDEGHAERIARSVRLLGEAAALDPKEIEGLVEAAYLHDVGEADLEELLAKPVPLSLEEQSRLEGHPLVGEEMVREMAGHPHAAWWVRWHHERLDGTGYPDGLTGDEIPLPAQILAVADAFEAITHRRPFRQALEPQDALAELRSMAGLHYDPQLIRLFTDRVFPLLEGV